jgi:hypothetical protein
VLETKENQGFSFHSAAGVLSSTMYQPHDTCEAAKTALEAPSDRSLRVACYCEENVWRLAHRRLRSNPKNSTYYVVFVSNQNHCVAMWNQIAGHEGTNNPVLWDYHVFLIETTDNNDDTTLVLDMDSHLPYPCALEEYVTHTFQTDMERYAPLFRVVEANMYLQHFSSDRSHMYDCETKTWSAPPPTYACIQPSESNGAFNLNEYIRMEKRKNNRGRLELLQCAKQDKFGITMTLIELQYSFSI